MKHILVPTDFSIYAGFAVDLAIKLATRSHAKITLVHNSDRLPEGWEGMTNEDQKAVIQADMELKSSFENMLKTKDAAHQSGIDVSIRFRSGILSQSLEDQLVESQIDLIIMGSHGASGKEEFFIGSNTQKVVRKVKCDMLIVKNLVSSIHFKKVVFASSLNLSERPAFRKFLSILEIFDTEEVHILSVNTPGFYSQPSILIQESLKEFAKMVSDYECETHFIPDLTVDAGIRHFNESINADLVAISNSDTNPLIRMLTGSNVEFLVNHADAPVLVVN